MPRYRRSIGHKPRFAQLAASRRAAPDATRQMDGSVCGRLAAPAHAARSGKFHLAPPGIDPCEPLPCRRSSERRIRKSERDGCRGKMIGAGGRRRGLLGRPSACGLHGRKLDWPGCVAQIADLVARACRGRRVGMPRRLCASCAREKKCVVLWKDVEISSAVGFEFGFSNCRALRRWLRVLPEETPPSRLSDDRS